MCAAPVCVYIGVPTVLLQVYVRQPTGNMVWMMRLQNHQQILEEGKQMSMDDLATLYGPGITPKMGQLGMVGTPTKCLLAFQCLGMIYVEIRISIDILCICALIYILSIFFFLDIYLCHLS